MSHTPGPWETQYLGNGESEVFAYGSSRDDVIGICIVAGGLGHVIGDNRDYESEANASLIAAAPDLLDALEECITEDGSASWCTFTNAKRRLEYINDIVRLAIKKAREG